MPQVYEEQDFCCIITFFMVNCDIMHCISKQFVKTSYRLHMLLSIFMGILTGVPEKHIHVNKQVLQQIFRKTIWINWKLWRGIYQQCHTSNFWPQIKKKLEFNWVAKGNTVLWEGELKFDQCNTSRAAQQCCCCEFTSISCFVSSSLVKALESLPTTCALMHVKVVSYQQKAGLCCISKIPLSMA